MLLLDKKLTVEEIEVQEDNINFCIKLSPTVIIAGGSNLVRIDKITNEFTLINSREKVQTVCIVDGIAYIGGIE